MGDKAENIKAMQEFSREASATLARAYPSLIILGAFITALINYYVTRFFWGRIYNLDLFHPARFSEWVVPEQTIWVFIGSCVLSIFPSNVLGFIGINFFLITLVAYFLQGLAILIYFLESRNVPVLFWFLIFFVIVLQPLLIGIGIGLGIFDIWMDLRKVKVARDGDLS